MKSHYRVVVIGGGIVGASVLYHLARKGWGDIALIERAELTAGSTWHAAAGFHAINDDPHIAALQAYTIKLYREIEAESGQSVGMHMPGGYSIATTPERWEWLQSEFAIYQTLGIEARLATPEEIVSRVPDRRPRRTAGWPLRPARRRSGSARHDARVCHRCAQARRRRDPAQPRDGTCDRTPTAGCVETEQGSIVAQHVVNAGGLWARRVGRMVGVDLPLTPMQHHYLITEDLPELLARPDEMPCVTDLEGFTYLQQERKGVILGVYERNPRHWKTEGAEWDYGMELLPEDIDRISPELLIGFSRFPSLQRAGIRKWVNGAFTFTPDGNPLVGPVPGLRNFWAACGCMGGFSQGGAIGKVLAELDRRGRPGHRHLRHGRRALRQVRSRRPLPARHHGAVLRATLRHRLSQRGAAGGPAARRRRRATRRSRRSARASAWSGAWSRRSISRPASRISSSRRRCDAPRPIGSSPRKSRRRAAPRACSTPACTHATKSADPARGMARPPARLAPARGRPHSPRADAQSGGTPDGRPHRHEARRGSLLARRFVLPAGVAPALVPRSPAGARRRRSRTSPRAGSGFSLSGPRSREILAALTHGDVSDRGLPFMGCAGIDVGPTTAVVARLSLTGELGYEINVPASQQRALWQALMEAGTPLGHAPDRHARAGQPAAREGLRRLVAGVLHVVHAGDGGPRALRCARTRVISSGAMRSWLRERRAPR